MSVAESGVRAARRFWDKARDTALNLRWRLDGDQPRVAITFDDGPDPVHTPAILDVLAELDVRATFFCVGDRVARHPDIVRRMVAEGHAVGSHGGTHVDLPTLSTRALLADLERGRDSLRKHAGVDTRLYRPTHGDRSLRTGVVARRFGLRTWLWTVDPEDWKPAVDAGQIVAGCTNLVAGDVILLHDALEQPHSPEATDRSATVEAIGSIVSAARAAGLDFARLPA